MKATVLTALLLVGCVSAAPLVDNIEQFFSNSRVIRAANSVRPEDKPDERISEEAEQCFRDLIEGLKHAAGHLGRERDLTLQQAVCQMPAEELAAMRDHYQYCKDIDSVPYSDKPHFHSHIGDESHFFKLEKIFESKDMCASTEQENSGDRQRGSGGGGSDGSGGRSGNRRPGSSDSRPGGDRLDSSGSGSGDRRPGGSDSRTGGRRPGDSGSRPGGDRLDSSGSGSGDRRPGGSDSRPGGRRPGGSGSESGDRRPGGSGSRPGGIPEEAEDCFRELTEVLKPAAELIRGGDMTLHQALCTIDPSINWEELRFHYRTCKEIYINNNQDADKQRNPPHNGGKSIFTKLRQIFASEELPTCAQIRPGDPGAGGSRFGSGRPESGSGSGSVRPGSGSSRPGSGSGSESDRPGSGGSRPGSGSNRPGSGSDGRRPDGSGSRPGAIPEEVEDCFRELTEVLKPAAELVRGSDMTLRQALCEMFPSDHLRALRDHYFECKAIHMQNVPSHRSDDSHFTKLEKIFKPEEMCDSMEPEDPRVSDRGSGGSSGDRRQDGSVSEDRLPGSSGSGSADRRPGGSERRPGGNSPDGSVNEDRRPGSSGSGSADRRPGGSERRPGGNSPDGSVNEDRRPGSSGSGSADRRPGGSERRPGGNSPDGSVNEDRRPGSSGSGSADRRPGGSERRPGGNSPDGSVNGDRHPGIPDEAEECFRELSEVLKPAIELLGRMRGLTLHQAICKIDPAIDWEELRFHYDTCKDIYSNNDHGADEQRVPSHKAARDLFLKLGKILASKEPPTCAPTRHSDVGAGENRFDSARPGSGSGSESGRPGSGGSRPGSGSGSESGRLGSSSGSESGRPGSGGSRPGSGRGSESGRPGSSSGSESGRPGSGGSRPGSGSGSESGRPGSSSGSESGRPGSGGSRPGSGSVSESGRPDTESGRPSFRRG